MVVGTTDNSLHQQVRVKEHCGRARGWFLTFALEARADRQKSIALHIVLADDLASIVLYVQYVTLPRRT